MSITVHQLRRTFGTTVALDGVSLEVKDRSLIALLGSSGSGKTTLLRIIAGLDFPDIDSGGSISFDGVDVTYQPAAERRIGFVFQHYALFPHMTVADNIAFGLTVRPGKKRPTKSEIRDTVDEMLERVQLPGYGKRLPSELSGGQRQRVALARALAIKPAVLLLDEPFGALDARVRKELRRWLRRFHEEIKVTTIFVTHDQEEALELADEVVILSHGRVEQSGSPQEIYDRPATSFVHSFLGEVNTIRVDGEIRHVRPHDVDLLFAADGSAEVCGNIRHLFSAGPVARLSIQPDNGDDFVEVQASRELVETMALSVGDPVGLRFRHALRDDAGGVVFSP
jgi:sulfate/thiosulfate transport system ATP-binding protein